MGYLIPLDFKQITQHTIHDLSRTTRNPNSIHHLSNTIQYNSQQGDRATFPIPLFVYTRLGSDYVDSQPWPLRIEPWVGSVIRLDDSTISESQVTGQVGFYETSTNPPLYRRVGSWRLPVGGRSIGRSAWSRVSRRRSHVCNRSRDFPAFYGLEHSFRPE